MLPVGWLVLAVVLTVVLTMWVTFTITRLDRLHARVDAAQAALDAQLVRRAAALQHVVESAGSGLSAPDRLRLDQVARTALATQLGDDDRPGIENAVGRAMSEISRPPSRADEARGAVRGALELREAATRVLIARRFYNDAVRDTRALRSGRLPRLLHLAGHRVLPDFFDIDDTLPPAPEVAAGDARLDADAHVDLGTDADASEPSPGSMKEDAS